jgi:hypothetical protein
VCSSDLNNVFKGGASGSLHIRGYTSSSLSASLYIENLNTSASFVVRDDGNVGVGTSTPITKLDVSGSARITDGLTVTGSARITGSLIIQGNSQVSGSLRGQVTALSVTSNTASLNMSTNNFFTLTLLNSLNGVTYINPTNINPGQTVSILITQPSTFPGSISFPSSIKQASGSAYTASAVSNAVDIITLIAFDASTVYLSAINRMI